MAYATVQDMRQKFGDAVLKQVTDEEAQTIDEAAVTRALEDASDFIDGYLQSRYSLPLNPQPRILRLQACDIAMYQLLVLRPQGDVEDARKRYEDAVRFLGSVAGGDIHLGLTEADEAAQSTGGPKVSGPDRTFSRESLKGF